MSPPWSLGGFAHGVAQATATDTIEAPAPPTLTAESLRERLDETASEELSSNVERWFRFLALGPEDFLELQALGIPTRHSSISKYTHVATVDDMVIALEAAERVNPVGLYCIFNELDPAVAARAKAGSWHLARKGESTSDRDVLARRALYIDVDAERVSGTSATEEELARAVGKSTDVLSWLTEHIPVEAIGMGHSGNGVSLFVALASLTETPELARLTRALLAGLDHRFSDKGAKVDRSVCDAKRLCPAFGTTKRKGASGLAERPHRRTGFWCAPGVTRLELPSLQLLATTLRSELDVEGQQLMDREQGVSKRVVVRSPARQTPPDKWKLPPSRFDRANAVPIADVAQWLGLAEPGGQVRCPGCGESDHGVALVGNGLKCHHARCAGKGVKAGFRTVVDVVAEVRAVAPREAAHLILEHFGQPVDGEPTPVAAELSDDQMVPAGAPRLGRQEISLSELEEFEVNDLVAFALGQLDDLYQRMGRIVRVQEGRTQAPGEVEATERAEIRTVSEALLRDRISRACVFYSLKLDRETGELKREPAHPPHWCVSAVAQRGEWSTVRHLQLVTDVPLLLGDGQVLTEPGYHAGTASLYRPAFTLPPLAELPTQEQAAVAASLLLSLIEEFPLERAEHRSAWLAALLTPIARWAFRDQCPLFLMDANQAGSGKGLLLKVIGWIVLGREMDVILQTEDEDEERKRITAKLLGGARMVQIDNVTKPFGSAPLDALLTTGIWAERLLGTNEAPALDSCAIWYGSGNNIGFRRDDTRRRTCMMRLLTEQERPEERTGFKIPDLHSHVKEHRAKLYAAALTVLRAWLCSGLSVDALDGWGGAWGSFGDWDRVVRGAIVYAGLVDPIAAKATSQDSEASSGGLSELLGGLEDALRACGLTEATTGRLCEYLGTGDDWSGLVRSGRPRSRLANGLGALSPKLLERVPTAHQLGRALSQVKDRPIRVGDTVKRLATRTLRGERLWRVESVGGGAAAAPSDIDPFDDVERAEREAIIAEASGFWN